MHKYAVDDGGGGHKKRKARKPKPKDVPFEEAMRRRDLQDVVWMIDSGTVSVNQETVAGETPLIAAVAINNVLAIELLFSRGADANAVNCHGYTPLMKAATVVTVDCSEGVLALLRHGADVLARDAGGKTALEWARLTNNTEVARRLEMAIQQHIYARRCAEASDDRARQHSQVRDAHARRSAQMAAAVATFNAAEISKIARDGTDEIPIDAFRDAYAGESKPPPYFMDVETSSGWTALSRAAANGDLTTLEVLLRAGATVDLETKLRHTALTWASYSGHKEVVQCLLLNHADVRRPTREGKTALMHASRNGQAVIAAILVGKMHELCVGKAKKDYVDTKTPEWHDLFLDTLLVTDATGKHALDHAMDHADVIRVLEKAKGDAEAHLGHVEQLKAKTSVVACKLGCGFEHAKDLIGHHEDHKCPRRLVDCEACALSIPSQALDDHKRRDCAGRVVTCVHLQYGCSTTLPWREMQIHQVEHCHYRDVDCRLECGKQLRWNVRDHHEAHDCPLRHVMCPACRVDLLGRDLRVHLKRQCPKRVVACALYGGCGEHHPFDETQFHVEYLCLLRPRPCRWAMHGCDAVVGPPEVRHAHEASTCEFRLVPCRNGCNVQTTMWCFLADHYEWDCPKEPKPCPLGCGATMDAQYLHAHQEPNCGFCPKRLSRCNLDLCGKKIVLFGDPDPTILARSDDILTAGAALSLAAAQERIHTLEAYLDTQLATTTPPLAHPFLRDTLAKRLQSMVDALAKLHLESTAVGLVLRFDAETERHLVSVHGVCNWLPLASTYYAEDPAEHTWSCGWRAADTRHAHEIADCVHKSVACPLGCGQLCQQHQVATHVKDRCLKRMMTCRLGCHVAMHFDVLLAHEESECPLSHQFCPHCRQSLLKQDVERHVERECPQYPRKCRLTCGRTLPSSAFHAHETTECPKRLVPCPACTKVLFAHELSDHSDTACPFRVAGPCALGCGVVLLHNQVQLHTSTACLHRCVTCPQCHDAAIRVVDLDYHTKYMCPERGLFCQKGCGARLRESDLARHELDDCVHRPASCPLHCGFDCAVSTLSKHMQCECPRRLVACPNRCQQAIPAAELAVHVRNCDHQMVPCGAGSAFCARPLKAWVAAGGLHRCHAHDTNGFMWALKTSEMDAVLTFLNLVDAPTVVDEEFATGFSPLTLACAKGNMALIRVLLLHGADVNRETSRGRTPLGEAMLGQHVPIVSLLLDRRAVAGYVNRHGLATLSIAEQMQHGDMLAILAKRQTLETLQRAIFVAIASSNYPAIEALVAGGEMAYRENHAWHLANELAASQTTLDEIRVRLAEHLDAMNKSIADSETKQMRVVKLLDSVEYNKAQLDHVQKQELKLEAVRQVTEMTVKEAVQSITAQDIVTIISQPNPPDGLLVVLKAMALFNGLIPRVKRGTDVNGFSDKEWWETAQAMLMDRQFLRKLVNFRDLDVPPDVLFKVRRECLKHEDFPHVSDFTPPPPENPPRSPEPRRRKQAITPFVALGTWVKGVEVNQKSMAEAKLLREKKASVQLELDQLDADLKDAMFHMKTAHRSLPSRQEELDRIIALEAKAAADFHLKQRRVAVCDLLAFTSLNGHTPLSFAAAIGNERAIRILLNRGANGSYSDAERGLAARVVQDTLRQLCRKTKLQGSELSVLSSIAGYLSLTPLLKKLKRHRQCNRVPLHEAVFNAHADVLALLVESGRARCWQPSFVEPVAVFPGESHRQSQSSTAPDMRVWKLHFRDKPMPLAASWALGRARLGCPIYRDGRGWDTSTTRYDDTQREMNALVAASEKRQAATRLQQHNRKAILRQHAAQKELHKRLDAAILAKDFVAAATLLDIGAFPEYATAGGLTVLAQACTEEIYVTNIDGDTVLAVDYLLDRPLNRPSPDYESHSADASAAFTPLLVAAHYGTVRCGRSLLTRGANIDVRTTLDGTTALMTAVRNNKDAFVDFLLEHRAAVLVKDIHGRSALSYAHSDAMLGRLSQAAADIQRVLLLDNRSSEYGLCRWGCGMVDLRDVPVIEAGRIVDLHHPLDDHEATVCPKRILPCPLACGAPDLWQEELPTHVETQCPKRPIACSIPKCTATLPWCDVRRHESAECVHRTVACPLCGEASLAHKLERHTHTNCRMRHVPCPACAAFVRAMDLASHTKFECDHRLVRCRLGCGFVESRVRTHHENSQCPKRPIDCAYGCDTGTTPETQAAHEQTCERRPVACPNKCTECLRACDVAAHLGACAHRFVPCPLGCGVKPRFADVECHIITKCRHRLVSCPKCGTEMPLAELEERHNGHCGARILPCGACGCGGIVAERMAYHKETECHMRLVECRFRADGCAKQPLFAHEQTTHETMECRYRPIWCPLGCRETLVAKELKSHEAACGMRFTVCSRGCGVELREKDRLDHEEYDCLYKK
ncbi:Aste57867_13883 [Aphanomyces stellatus]|uniref:Aste57867_13883 protein n=1 Tax=Aphanomyces stellatus TaxID=120398 RepID=A0A485L070_9STRA|nr:hypothetical protein As57867_013832 [Aphanomyces stellatus]VFT90714.1 Aste57867_13883 [Aphanomyces stellatus]